MKESVFALLVFFVTAAQATPPICPLVDESNINGTWEAIKADADFRYYRLVLSEDGGHMYQSFPTGRVLESELIEKNFHEGTFSLKFQYVGDMKRIVGIKVLVDGTEYVSSGIVVVEGEGRVCNTAAGGETYLKTNVVVHPELPNVVSWPLYFHASRMGPMQDMVSKSINSVLKKESGNSIDGQR